MMANWLHPAWPPEHERILREMFERGESLAEIGKRLGRSKSAVMGKVDRLGLRRRRDWGPGRQRAVRERPTGPPAPALSRTQKCHYIAGDPRETYAEDDSHFCGKRAVEGTAYCPRHLELVTGRRAETEPEPEIDERDDEETAIDGEEEE